MKWKALVPKEVSREHAHPVDDHLVNVNFEAFGDKIYSIALYSSGRELQPSHFAVVVNSYSSHIPNDNSRRELTLDLKVSGLEFATGGLLDGCKVELGIVSSLKTFRRQWNGLINLHTSLLIRDILSPRGGDYFCSQTSTLEHANQVKILLHPTSFLF